MAQTESEQVLGEMHSKMDRTRQQWEEEVSKLKSDFFNLKPEERLYTTSGGSKNATSTNKNRTDVLGSLDSSGIFVDSGIDKKKFRVSFDVSQFSPNEVSVRTQDSKLIVQAKHEESAQGKNVSREFNRQVDIPKYLDPNTLKSMLRKDGVLEVEAPICTLDDLCDEGQNKSGSRSSHQQNGTCTNTTPTVNPTSSLPPLSIPSSWSTGTPSPGMSSGSPSPGIKPGTIYTEQDGSQKLKMVVDVGSDFKPHEVVVKTVSKKLKISAKHEEHKDSRTTKKEFNKEFELPEEVDPNSVTAAMTEDGKLIIEAPISGFVQGSYQGKPGSLKQPEVTVSFK